MMNEVVHLFKRLLAILKSLEKLSPWSIFFLNYSFIFSCAGSSLLLGAFSGCGEWGLFFIAAPRLLIVWLLLLHSTGSGLLGFSSCSTWAQSWCRAWLLQGLCDLPGPGIKPVSPALAGRFLSTMPPGKSGPFFN